MHWLSDDTTILIRKYLHGNLLRPLVSSITLPSPSIMDWIWPARLIIPGSSGMLSKIPWGLIYTVSDFLFWQLSVITLLHPFSLTLNLLFSDKPKIAIALGRSINAHQIKQGDDVYFECKVLAYPQVRTVHWLKDVSSTPACSPMIKTTLYCIRWRSIAFICRER